MPGSTAEGSRAERKARDAHAPNKVQNIQDVFLMRLGGKDDRGAPRPETFVDPAIGFRNVEVGHNNGAFVGPIMRLLAADRGRGAGIDSEFEI